MSTFKTIAFIFSVACATPSLAAEADYTCSIQYVDSGIQERPLFTESFQATITPSSEGVQKPFGVSPGNGSYYAYIAPNRGADISNDIALMIGNSVTQLNTISLFSSAAPVMFLQLSVTQKQTLSIVCRHAQAAK